MVALRDSGSQELDDSELNACVVIFTTWRQIRRQMANRRLPREGRKDATKPAHAVPLASARAHGPFQFQTHCRELPTAVLSYLATETFHRQDDAKAGTPPPPHHPA